MTDQKRLENMERRINDMWERSVAISNTLIVIKSIMEKWDAQRDAERQYIYETRLNELAVGQHRKKNEPE